VGLALNSLKIMVVEIAKHSCGLRKTCIEEIILGDYCKSGLSIRRCIIKIVDTSFGVGDNMNLWTDVLQVGVSKSVN